MNRKAELDAADEGGVPVLDENYPPHDAPLYWEEFKAWATDNLPDYSLAVIDEQLAEPVIAAGLQCYRAGRIARRHGMSGGRKVSWTSWPGPVPTYTSGQRILMPWRWPSGATKRAARRRQTRLTRA